jgi:hypothetical protein
MSSDSSRTAHASASDGSPSEPEPLGQNGEVRRWRALFDRHIDDLQSEGGIVDSPLDLNASSSWLEEKPVENAPKTSSTSENQANGQPIRGELRQFSLTAVWACGRYQDEGLINIAKGRAEFSFTPNLETGPINVILNICNANQSRPASRQSHNNRRNDGGAPTKRGSRSRFLHRISKSSQKSGQRHRSRRAHAGDTGQKELVPAQ